ncbi:ATP-binding protein [Priestia megaterium]
MIPQTLNDWSIDIIKELLQKGYFETETFDFKEMLPRKGDQGGKLRITEACSAFANSSGGFLVFGIKDDKSLSVEDRLVGVDPSIDFPEHFGNYPQACIPSVDWTFLNPPLKTYKGREIHVVQIFKSLQSPHSVKGKDKGFIFTKRTNKGVEEMSYNEIKHSYLGYYEKYLKLQLLVIELHNIKEDAVDLMEVLDEHLGKSIRAITFDTSILQSVMSDTALILSEHPKLIVCLNGIRKTCRDINNHSSMIFSIVNMPMDLHSKRGIVTDYHNHLKSRYPTIIKFIDEAISYLKDILGDK